MTTSFSSLQNANLLGLLGDCYYYLEDAMKAKDCYEKVVEYVTPPAHIIAVLLRLADLYMKSAEVSVCWSSSNSSSSLLLLSLLLLLLLF